jgi:hypothetical protein
MLRCCLLLILVGCCAGGCATGPYQYGGVYHTDYDPPLPPEEEQIERGRTMPIVDAVGWLVGTPKRVLLLKWNVDNHHVSDKTEYELREYMVKNGLDKVKVQINEYDPWSEWARLSANQSICGPLRYSVGALYVTGYTLLPGRIWGGDNFSPWTNTIHLYSDVPELAIYQGAQAKQCAKREHKWLGTGKFRAMNDTFAYLRNDGTTEELRNAYACVVPTVVADFVPIWAWTTLGLPAVGAGHVAGRTMGLAVHAPANHQGEIAAGVVRLPTTSDAPSPADAGVVEPSDPNAVQPAAWQQDVQYPPR